MALKVNRQNTCKKHLPALFQRNGKIPGLYPKRHVCVPQRQFFFPQRERTDFFFSCLYKHLIKSLQLPDTPHGTRLKIPDKQLRNRIRILFSGIFQPKSYLSPFAGPQFLDRNARAMRRF